MDMQEDEVALEKAIESGDTDLGIYIHIINFISYEAI